MQQNINETIKRDRNIVILGLSGVILVAWIYTIYLSRHMIHEETGMELMSPHPHPWTSVDFALNFLMWVVMQIAMMTPTAVPMLLFYTKVTRQKYPEKQPYLKTSLFLLGYLVVWTGFSLMATLVQWGLNNAALVSAGMVQATPLVGGVILIAAGAFQFSPTKDACLSHCRTPVGFIMTDWREGKRGAFKMGLKHGAYCVGCCWLLMALLFALGVMNVLWMAALTIFLLIEKLAPSGDRIGKIVGSGFILWGIWMLAEILI